MAEPILQLQGVGKSFGGLRVCDDINFTLVPGELHALIGPNGAGKTTTVRMLTGLLKPKAGKALLLGMDVAKNAERVQGKIGVCFEDTNLYEQMSAIENLRLFARLFGIN